MELIVGLASTEAGAGRGFSPGHACPRVAPAAAAQLARAAAVPCQTIIACLIPSWPERPPPRRPRARELEARNAELTTELGGLEQALAHDMAALQADHELLRQQCGRWEAEACALCARHGEPLPLGLAA